MLERHGDGMTVQELIDKQIFSTLCVGEDTDKEITKLFCCDLLSIAMGKLPEGAAWVTVMANINTLAVAMLAEAGCIIFAEGVKPDAATIEKAKAQNMTLLVTELPVFEAALAVNQELMN